MKYADKAPGVVKKHPYAAAGVAAAPSVAALQYGMNQAKKKPGKA